jgi:hypothetical protein
MYQIKLQDLDTNENRFYCDFWVINYFLLDVIIPALMH